MRITITFSAALKSTTTSSLDGFASVSLSTNPRPGNRRARTIPEHLRILLYPRPQPKRLAIFARATRSSSIRTRRTQFTITGWRIMSKLECEWCGQCVDRVLRDARHGDACVECIPARSAEIVRSSAPGAVVPSIGEVANALRTADRRALARWDIAGLESGLCGAGLSPTLASQVMDIVFVAALSAFAEEHE